MPLNIFLFIDRTLMRHLQIKRHVASALSIYQRLRVSNKKFVYLVLGCLVQNDTISTAQSECDVIH